MLYSVAQQHQLLRLRAATHTGAADFRRSWGNEAVGAVKVGAVKQWGSGAAWAVRQCGSEAEWAMKQCGQCGQRSSGGSEAMGAAKQWGQRSSGSSEAVGAVKQ